MGIGLSSVLPNQRPYSSVREERPIHIVGITLSLRSFATADIVLRNLEDDLKEKLHLRAASNQRSMNAELREIVRTALARPVVRLSPSCFSASA